MLNYQPYNYGMNFQSYADRLAQFQNNYQQAVNIPQMQTAPQINQGLLWVSGEAGAKAYLVAPNSTVLLMDSELQRFYLKSADGAGMPSMRVFEYQEVGNAPLSTLQVSNSNDIDLDDKYVKREEYKGLKRQYEEIVDKLNSMESKSKQKKGEV